MGLSKIFAILVILLLSIATPAFASGFVTKHEFNHDDIDFDDLDDFIDRRVDAAFNEHRFIREVSDFDAKSKDISKATVENEDVSEDKIDTDTDSARESSNSVSADISSDRTLDESHFAKSRNVAADNSVRDVEAKDKQVIIVDKEFRDLQKNDIFVESENVINDDIETRESFDQRFHTHDFFRDVFSTSAFRNLFNKNEDFASIFDLSKDSFNQDESKELSESESASLHKTD